MLKASNIVPLSGDMVHLRLLAFVVVGAKEESPLVLMVTGVVLVLMVIALVFVFMVTGLVTMVVVIVVALPVPCAVLAGTAEGVMGTDFVVVETVVVVFMVYFL